MESGNLIKGSGEGSSCLKAELKYFSFEVVKLKVNETYTIDTKQNECGVVILSGFCGVSVNGGDTLELGQRKDIFEGIPPHVLIAPHDSHIEIIARTDLHFSVSQAENAKDKGTIIIRPGRIEGKKRGERNTFRTVYDLVPPGTDTRLMLYEVFTPEGNWSSYPPHKHDTEEPPKESLLEETYYYRFDPPGGFAFQWVYNDDLTLNEVYAVKNDDLVLVEKGYHTLVTAPGYMCYCHCVMAGPTREWNFTVDKNHAHLLNWGK